MKYFLFHEFAPYYGLIKADNADEAMEIYIKEVADLDEDMGCTELSYQEAFEEIKKVPCETVGEALEFLKEFHSKEKCSTVVDNLLL